MRMYVSPTLVLSSFASLAAKKKLDHVALTYVSGPEDEAVKAYRINTGAKVKNTVLVYKNRMVSSKFINLVADKSGLESLDKAIHSVVQ